MVNNDTKVIFYLIHIVLIIIGMGILRFLPNIDRSQIFGIIVFVLAILMGVGLIVGAIITMFFGTNKDHV